MRSFTVLNFLIKIDSEYDQDIKIWILSAEQLIRHIEFFIPPRFQGNHGSLINKEFIAALKKLKLDYIQMIAKSNKKINEKEQTQKIYQEIMKQINLGLEYMELVDTIIITDIDYSKVDDVSLRLTKELLRSKIETIRNKIPKIRGQLVNFLRFLSEIYNNWSRHYVKKEYYDRYT